MSQPDSHQQRSGDRSPIAQESEEKPAVHHNANPQGLFACFTDAKFWIAMLLGPVVWLLMWGLFKQPLTLATGISLLPLLMVILVYPVLEEIVFRGALQGWLLKRLPGSFFRGQLTQANLLTSVVFTGFHFVHHAPLAALLVFMPSMVFGWVRDRYTVLTGSITLHVLYNAGYFLLFG